MTHRVSSSPPASLHLEYSARAPVTALAFWEEEGRESAGGRGAFWEEEGRESAGKTGRRRSRLLLAGDVSGGLLAFDASPSLDPSRSSTMRMAARHAGGVTAVASSSSHSLAASGAADGRVFVWRRDGSRRAPAHSPVASFVASFPGGNSPVRGIGFGGGGLMITWSGSAAKIWNVASSPSSSRPPRPLSTLRDFHRGWISSAALAPCCPCCACSCSSAAGSAVAVTGGATDGRVCWWDLAPSSRPGATAAASLPPSGGGVSALSPCPRDGRVVVAAAASSPSLFVCDSRAKGPVAEVELGSSSFPPRTAASAVKQLAWDRSSPTPVLAASGGDGVFLVDLRAPGRATQVVRSAPAAAVALSTSPSPEDDGGGTKRSSVLLATAARGDAVVRTWRVSTERQQQQRVPQRPPPLAAAPVKFEKETEREEERQRRKRRNDDDVALSRLAAALETVAAGADEIGERAAGAGRALAGFCRPSVAASH